MLRFDCLMNTQYNSIPPTTVVDHHHVLLQLFRPSLTHLPEPYHEKSRTYRTLPYPKASNANRIISLRSSCSTDSKLLRGVNVKKTRLKERRGLRHELAD